MTSSHTHLATWVTHETKQRFRAVAQMHEVSESAMLKRLVDAAVASASISDTHLDFANKTSRSKRLYVRLRPDDQLLLRERSAARGMPTATYVSILIRAHLRTLAPLPKEELLALKQSISQLGAIGRNLNQIARIANQGQASVPSRDDLRALLKACEALRDHVKNLLKVNLESWEVGYDVRK